MFRCCCFVYHNCFFLALFVTFVSLLSIVHLSMLQWLQAMVHIQTFFDTLYILYCLRNCNFIKIISLTCSPLLICRVMIGDLMKSPLRVKCEWQYIRANENGDCETMKILLICFEWYEQSDWMKNIFIISLYIYAIRTFAYDP
jgi:hypothetical protein